MAIYHCSIKNIGRSGGKSAVASAAYRAGKKLYDEEQGKTYYYTKPEVVYSEIFLCENAPTKYQDRATLWNAVEEVEKQSNARFAREWEVALPRELNLEQSKELIKEFAQSLAKEGMCVDANIHWKDGNHHAHIMGTTRSIKENGEWGQKEKKVYKLDENGEKIPQIDPTTGEQKIGARGRKMWERETVEANDWNKTEKVEEWRERWAEHCNRYLEKVQSFDRVDHRSYERQGKERIPTIHEGNVARRMEQDGQTAERCEINREIKTENLKLNSLDHKQGFFTRLLEQLKAELQEKLKIQKDREGALNERLQQLRLTRTANGPAGGNASGNRTIQTDNQQSRADNNQSKDTTARTYETTGRAVQTNNGTNAKDNRPGGEDNKPEKDSIAERLASLRSRRTGGENQQGAGRQDSGMREPKQTDGGRGGEEQGDTIQDIIASARAGIDSATAREQDSEASRADREAERSRLDAKRKREAEENKQQLERERAESKARSNRNHYQR